MLQKYSELIKEIISIPYSKDMFEIEKESAELSIMEKYIENQLYLQENFNENSPVDYMMEKAEENKLSSIMNTIKEKSAKLGERLWNMLIKVWEMMAKAFSTIRNWLTKNFKKEKINKAKILLSKAISHNESVDTFTESNEDNNTRNKVLQTFMKSYINASKHFTNRLRNSPGSLKNIFNKMKITLEGDNTNLDLNSFFKLEESGKSKQDSAKLAKIFISILECDINKIKFEIDDPDFKIMPIEDYKIIMDKIYENIQFLKNSNNSNSDYYDLIRIFILLPTWICTSIVTELLFPGIPNDTVKLGISLFSAFAITHITTLIIQYFYIKYKLKRLTHEKLLNYFKNNQGYFIANFSNYDIIKIPNYIRNRIIPENTISIRRIIDPNNFRDIFKSMIDEKERNSQLKEVLEKILKNENIHHVKLSDLEKNDSKFTHIKRTIFSYIRQFPAYILQKYKNHVMKKLGIDEECFEDIKKLFKQGEYYKGNLLSLYCQVGVNITALYNCAAEIFNIIYKMCDDIIKANNE